jgi:hypothetical protein
MVEGPGSVGPRGGRRSSWPPHGASREYRDPQALERWIEQGLKRADDELARSDANEAAVSYSTVARKCMDRASIGDREAAIDWIARSIDPRTRAIELFHQVGRQLDEARDHSFLGKAFSRLGIMRKDQRSLARGVFERTLALELFRQLRQVKLQAEELSYLADDFRAMGWLENDPQLKRYILIKSSGYSDAALQLYPRFLMGEELEERKLHEEGFIALASGCAALCAKDPVEIRAARDRCQEMADRLIRHGSDYHGNKLKDNARALDALLASLSF